jgi:glycosyltransferase involved in cell wall biosynthesis
LNKQPVAIHQFHYSASGADAVTNHMLLIQSSLREAGIAGDIFAVHRKAPASMRIRPFEMSSFWDADLVLIHHSHGNPALSKVLKTEVPKALIYHNITPPEFFKHDSHMSSFSELGRKQLGLFEGKILKAFGVSKFNSGELELAGLHKAEVFPLLDLQSTPKILSARLQKPRARNVRKLLFVGKLTPHKNQALLIRTLFYLNQISDIKYLLVLAGRSDPLYAEYLRLLTSSLGLQDHVELTGPVTAEAMEGHFAQADAFVCASLHEGFCVPLVEAMQRQVPIFALPRAGVRETLGRAGFRFTSTEPFKMAHTIHAALSNQSAIDSVLTAQDERLVALSEVHNRKRILDLCTSLVDRLRGPQKRLPPEIYL